MKSVLLLNTSYEPLRVISWRRAITLYFLNKVEILEVYDRVIHSVNFAFPAPSVVRLLNFVKFYSRSIPLTRQNLVLRDQFCCQYCGKSVSGLDITIDHVVPRSKGGQSCWENLVVCCSGCNKKKANRTPAEAGMTLLKPPRKPVWLPIIRSRHFDREVPKEWKDYLFAG